MYKSLILLLSIVFSSTVSSIALVESTLSTRPNLVLIVIDTLRSDRLSCYGFLEKTSPELDAMAKEGIQFQRVVSTSSWTRPAIGSLLTSQYPRRLGIYKERDQILPDEFLTLAEALQQEGYRTIGYTANANINQIFNFHQGFDHYVDSTVVFSFMEKGEEEQFWRQSKVKPAREIFQTALERVSADPVFPCYLQLTVMDVHEWYRGKQSLIRPEFQNLYEGFSYRQYLQGLRQTSKDIGEFIEQLRDLPGWNNTLFVITSDHGEGLSSHPSVEESQNHGKLLYESQLMIPFILYHPAGHLIPAVIQRPVRILDIMPTVMDYIGIPLPEKLEGVSLLPLFSDSNAEVGLPRNFVAETQLRKYDKIAVYSPEWKYIHNRDGHQGVNEEELQPIGINEDGKNTDQILNKSEIAAPLKSYLRLWEKAIPMAPPTVANQELSQEELDQLKAIGYLK